MAQLRIALTVSGAVSLGAYEGGVLAALLVALQRLLEERGPDEEAPMVIDTIGGASAGSITGLLTARAALEGLDPIWVMKEAWVDRADIRRMRTRDPHSPLSTEVLKGVAKELLDENLEHRVARPQPGEVRLRMALACLQGLDYHLVKLDRKTKVEATTYLDWADYRLTTGSLDQYVTPAGASAVEAALASSANAIGFPPKLLNRKLRAEDCEAISTSAVRNIPKDGWLWYTDGGTLDNEPLGRTLELANDIDRRAEGDSTRLHVLVHPAPSRAGSAPRWTNWRAQPNWSDTGLRALSMQRTQSEYADLLTLEKTNTRLRWKSELIRALAHTLDPQQVEALREVLRGVDQEKVRIDELRFGASTRTPVDRSHRRDEQLLDEVLEVVSGLGGKREVDIEVVSPLVLADTYHTEDVSRMLAGEFLFSFGGFLDRKLRLSDFDLGYQSASKWMAGGGLTAGGAGDGGLPEPLAELALQAVTTRYRPRPLVEDGGSRRIGPGAKLSLLRVLAHVARVIVTEKVLGRRKAGALPHGAPAAGDCRDHGGADGARRGGGSRTAPG
jgi:predicted acylesterase/phospholipase RssA